MENLLDDSLEWPYPVGRVGGVLVALGAFLMLRGSIAVGYGVVIAGALLLVLCCDQFPRLRR